MKRPKNVMLVLFSIDDSQFALHLSWVERVISAVYVNPLPKAPEIILGVINMEGTIIPVIDVRKRLQQEIKPILPSDHFIIVQTPTRIVALHVDKVGDVLELEEAEIISDKDVLPDMPYVKGLFATKDGLILINDIDNFLSLEEESMLHQALENK